MAWHNLGDRPECRAELQTTNAALVDENERLIAENERYKAWNSAVADAWGVSQAQNRSLTQANEGLEGMVARLSAERARNTVHVKVKTDTSESVAALEDLAERAERALNVAERAVEACQKMPVWVGVDLGVRSEHNTVGSVRDFAPDHKPPHGGRPESNGFGLLRDNFGRRA